MTALKMPRPSLRLASASAVLIVALVLGGCASGPRRGGDGAPSNPPAGLASVPDAVPRIEPIRTGGPNKPYQALGREYVPMTGDLPYHERGLASWYGRLFQGKRTSSGEPYDMYAMTAAHPTLPIPSYARIRNPANGRQVIVRINDRGPFHAGRIVDLSYAAALRLDLLRGVAPVELDRITFDEIRAGNWRHGDDANARWAAADRPAAPSASLPPAAPPMSGSMSSGPTIASAPRAPVPMSSMSASPVPATPLSSSTAMAASQALPVPTPSSLPSPATLDASPGVAAAAAAPRSPPSPPETIVAAPERPAQRPSSGFWVQLGAFREAAGAESFERRVAAEVGDLAARLATFDEAPFYRVQAGPYESRDEAQGVAARLRDALGLVPLIVERR